MIRNRFNECALCQFPDTRCDEYRYLGTGFCSTHLSVMRVRRSAGKFGGVSARAAQEVETPEPCNFCPSITEDSRA